jgi:hypothetical protein
MAGPLDTWQEIASHLFFHIIPIVLYHLIFLVLPEDPMLFRFLTKTSTWRFRGHPRGARPKRIKCFKKLKKKLISNMQDKTFNQKLPTYLMPALFAALKVGCCVEHKLCRFLCLFQRAPRAFAPEEFVAEENLNFEKEISVDEGVESDDETVKKSNLPIPPDDEPPSEAIQRGPLTFDPSPPQEEKGEDVHLATANNQAELMRWHYRLGHITL